MPDKRSKAKDYLKAEAELVRAACLYVATKLGDLVEELVVVGGLVPSLLIPEDSLGDTEDAHVGTMDLDLGLAVALLDHRRYQTLTQRLRSAGLHQDSNQDGRSTRQRWRFDRPPVTVDFLIPPTQPEDRGGTLRDIEPDFAAIITPGLHLAFRDRRRITLSSRTITGERATREIWVCGPGAYVVLKALAFRNRGENKDAYDLFYVIRNYGSGIEDVARALQPLRDDRCTATALDILGTDFLDPEALGPRRVAEFFGGPDDSIQADAAGLVRKLLELCISD